MDHSQKNTFLNSEGDQWFERNRLKISDYSEANCRIFQAVKKLPSPPKRILEIGCSNGIRLAHIQSHFGIECTGIDPSSAAISDGTKRFPNLNLHVGTADHLDFANATFDTIIFGFCLYLCDRNDLFKIVYEADRCLTDPGNLIIMDFYPSTPLRNEYAHKENTFSYKMNYAGLFTANPAYTEISNSVFTSAEASIDDPNERMAVNILRKNSVKAYPSWNS